MELKIKRITNWCPTQWEGFDVEGRPYYLRYEGLRLDVHRGELGQTLLDIYAADAWFTVQDGIEGYGEHLSNARLRRILMNHQRLLPDLTLSITGVKDTWL